MIIDSDGSDTSSSVCNWQMQLCAVRLLASLLALLSVAVTSFSLRPYSNAEAKVHHSSPGVLHHIHRHCYNKLHYSAVCKASKDDKEGISASEALEKSLLNAKVNIESNSSPGANLQTADEQADAAFADIIYSSMQQRGIAELSEEDKELLAKGATMWEKGAKKEKKTTLFGNIMSVVEALSGGAHITKNNDFAPCSRWHWHCHGHWGWEWKHSEMSCIDLTCDSEGDDENNQSSGILVGDDGDDDDDGGFVAIVGDSKDAEFRHTNLHLFGGNGGVQIVCPAKPQLLAMLNDTFTNSDVLRYVNRKYAVNLKGGEDNNVIVYGEQVNIDIFINEVIRCEEVFFTAIEKRRQEKISIFIDHSNTVCTDGGSTGRVDIREMIRALVDLRDATKQVVCGSHGSSSSSDVSREYESIGFEVYFQARHNGKEVCVDELLHGQMAIELLKTYDNRRTMILVTGDGNANSGRSTFPTVVEQALKKGWSVEVYSWRTATSRVWMEFEKNYVSDFKLFFLDEIELHITYKAGSNRSSTSSKRVLCSAVSSHKTSKKMKKNNMTNKKM